MCKKCHSQPEPTTGHAHVGGICSCTTDQGPTPLKKLPTIRAKTFGVPLKHAVYKTVMQGAYITGRGRKTEEHALLYKGDIQNLPEDAVVLIRINSACSTGDIFHDTSCDCNWQFEESLRIMDEQDGPGLVLYHFAHEGKAHGYLRKLQSFDGVMYPVPSDDRDFTHAIAILKDLGIKRVRVMTNNPEKQQILRDYGIEIVATVPIVSKDPAVADLYRYKERVWHHKLPTDLDTEKSA